MVVGSLGLKAVPRLRLEDEPPAVAIHWSLTQAQSVKKKSSAIRCCGDPCQELSRPWEQPEVCMQEAALLGPRGQVESGSRRLPEGQILLEPAHCGWAPEGIEHF
jgi:hypothetical protein